MTGRGHSVPHKNKGILLPHQHMPPTPNSAQPQEKLVKKVASTHEQPIKKEGTVMTINGKDGLLALLEPVQKIVETQPQVRHSTSTAVWLSFLNPNNNGSNALMLLVAKVLLFCVCTVILAPANSLNFNLMHSLNKCFAPQHCTHTHTNRLPNSIHSLSHNLTITEVDHHNFHIEHQNTCVIILIAKMLISGVYLFFPALSPTNFHSPVPAFSSCTSTPSPYTITQCLSRKNPICMFFLMLNLIIRNFHMNTKIIQFPNFTNIPASGTEISPSFLDFLHSNGCNSRSPLPLHPYIVLPGTCFPSCPSTRVFPSVNLSSEWFQQSAPSSFYSAQNITPLSYLPISHLPLPL